MVDSRNIDEPAPQTGDKLVSIFKRQEDLLDKYKKIEGMPSLPLDIDVFEGQVWVKDFLWRITEELAEAGQLLTQESFLHDALTSEDRVVLFQEEVADAFHFLVELALLVSSSSLSAMANFSNWNDLGSGDTLDIIMETARAYSASTVVEFCLEDEGGYASKVWPFVHCLGIVGTTLKNKKWKKSQMITDMVNFRVCLNTAFFQFYVFLARLGFTSELLYQIYFKKSRVNRFRQESDY